LLNTLPTAKMPWYHVAEPNAYLVVTGVGIERVKIQKKASKELRQQFSTPRS
jgi:hypothetical protein